MTVEEEGKHAVKGEGKGGTNERDTGLEDTRCTKYRNKSLHDRSREAKLISEKVIVTVCVCMDAVRCSIKAPIKSSLLGQTPLGELTTLGITRGVCRYDTTRDIVPFLSLSRRNVRREKEKRASLAPDGPRTIIIAAVITDLCAATRSCRCKERIKEKNRGEKKTRKRDERKRKRHHALTGALSCCICEGAISRDFCPTLYVRLHTEGFEHFAKSHFRARVATRSGLKSAHALGARERKREVRYICRDRSTLQRRCRRNEIICESHTFSGLAIDTTTRFVFFFFQPQS